MHSIGGQDLDLSTFLLYFDFELNQSKFLNQILDLKDFVQQTYF